MKANRQKINSNFQFSEWKLEISSTIIPIIIFLKFISRLFSNSKNDDCRLKLFWIWKFSVLTKFWHYNSSENFSEQKSTSAELTIHLQGSLPFNINFILQNPQSTVQHVLLHKAFTQTFLLSQPSHSHNRKQSIQNAVKVVLVRMKFRKTIQI